MAQVDVQDPDEIYDAFKSNLRGYYDNMHNTGHLINERDSLEAINQNTGERTHRHIGYLFDILFIPTVIRRRIPVAVYSEVKKRVMTDGQEFALNYVNEKIRESTTGRRSSSRSSSSGAKKGSGLTRTITHVKAKPKTTSRATKTEIVYDQQPMMQPQPVATGSGKHRRQKAASRLKPIKEDEEAVELIKPDKTHISYLDLNKDVLLVNKLHGKTT